MDYPLPDSEIPAKRTESSAWVVLLSLISLMFVGLIVGSLISFGAINASGFDAVGFISSLSPESSPQERNLARWANLLPHLFAFTGGAITAALIFFGRNWIQQLGLKVLPNWKMIGGGLLFMLGTFPFVQTTYWLNQQLPLPAWMKEMEVNANELIKIILHMDGPAELVLNLLTVGVVAAVGEELVFRGILQQQLSRVIKQPILAIWVTAIVFSAIHLQFAGFLPRMFLGVGLGYLFYWSKSLWLPILAHFIFNSLQVVVYYVLGDKAGQFSPEQAVDSPGWLGGIFGLALMIGVGYYLSRMKKQQS